MIGQAIKKKERRINYIKDLENLKFIKISHDFNTVIFANNTEIFILEFKQKEGYGIKREIAKI